MTCRKERIEEDTKMLKLIQQLGRIRELSNREVRMLAKDNDPARAWKITEWSYYLHLMEEDGEVTRCMRHKNPEPMNDECVDVVVCALALAMLHTNYDFGPIVKTMKKKIDKWEGRLEKLKQELET